MPFYNNLVFRFISTNKPASQQALLQIFVSKTINYQYLPTVGTLHLSESSVCVQLTYIIISTQSDLTYKTLVRIILTDNVI